ncbi:LysE/ArgO family amino acid transporter [Variovorax sp. UMC13]|uniref:LysE/ArgO family amino acid transporter n=1 Tax=Variovorax sp. UMC13 TaxID=1862326 RepID=UPI001600B5A9|nr:LysE/ArgO family amino acid transporter [Variovorax sp. UMC13]MBB1601128.1 amino acid transporter [Variovorax sp. UMC13]
MSSFALSALPHGFAMSLVLIVAIGAQNAFVLRQGLRREHVTAVVVFCALGDALLVALGVLGMAQLLQGRPGLAAAMAFAGAAFLAAYGLRSLWRARRVQGGLVEAGRGAASRRAVLAQAAAFTLLNPHVYLDTVLFVGGTGAQYAGPARAGFVAGAALASALWFSALGFGARLLAPWFERPRAWQWVDGAIGCAMLLLAWLLLRHGLSAG